MTARCWLERDLHLFHYHTGLIYELCCTAFSYTTYTGVHTQAYTGCILVWCNVFHTYSGSLSYTNTHTDTLDCLPQGRSFPECSEVEKLSLKLSSSANGARQSLGKWLCNQPPLTPFPSLSQTFLWLVLLTYTSIGTQEECAEVKSSINSGMFNVKVSCLFFNTHSAMKVHRMSRKLAPSSDTIT